MCLRTNDEATINQSVNRKSNKLGMIDYLQERQKNLKNEVVKWIHTCKTFLSFICVNQINTFFIWNFNSDHLLDVKTEMICVIL